MSDQSHNNAKHHRRGFRSHKAASPPAPSEKRFDIFLIDTAWNKSVSKAVRSQLRHLSEFHPVDSLYVLSPEQSFEVIKRAPELMGCDPTLIVYDLYGPQSAESGNYRGFRLNLGLMRNAEESIARLQEFLRFIAMHRTAEHLSREVRRDLHRKGFEGVVKLLRETSVDLLVE